MVAISSAIPVEQHTLMYTIMMVKSGIGNREGMKVHFEKSTPYSLHVREKVNIRSMDDQPPSKYLINPLEIYFTS